MVQLTPKIDFEALTDPTFRFDLIEVIGEGSYGEVYSAIDLENDKGLTRNIIPVMSF